MRDSTVSQLQIKLFVLAGRRNSGVSASTNGFPRVYRGWGLKRSVCMLGDLERKKPESVFPTDSGHFSCSWLEAHLHLDQREVICRHQIIQVRQHQHPLDQGPQVQRR